MIQITNYSRRVEKPSSHNQDGEGKKPLYRKNREDTEEKFNPNPRRRSPYSTMDDIVV